MTQSTPLPILEKTSYVRVMGSMNNEKWNLVEVVDGRDYTPAVLERHAPSWGYLRADAYDGNNTPLGTIRSFRVSPTTLASNGRLYPTEPAPLQDYECQLRRLRGALAKASREADQLYQWYRETQTWKAELQETILYLESKQFIEGKGILKVGRTSIKHVGQPHPRAAKAAAAKKALVATQKPNDLLELLKRTDPVKYQAVLTALAQQTPKEAPND